MFERRSLPFVALGLACALATRCGSASPEHSTGDASPSAAASSASRAPSSTPASSAAVEVPSSDAQLQSTDDLPPLPLTPFPAARSPGVVRTVYTFAARHPGILSHVPCFCGCENRGHTNNDDCFVTSRDARGRVTAWEPHGVG